jgi:hypothetical protein
MSVVRFSPKKITVTWTKVDSSHESGKNFITWTWLASTTIIYNNHYLAREKISLLGVFFLFPVNIFFASYIELTAFGTVGDRLGAWAKVDRG